MVKCSVSNCANALSGPWIVSVTGTAGSNGLLRTNSPQLYAEIPSVSATMIAAARPTTARSEAATCDLPIDGGRQDGGQRCIRSPHDEPDARAGPRRRALFVGEIEQI